MNHRILPVIHYRDDEQALDNAALAFEVGCDGVLVISMDGNDEALSPIALAIKDKWPERKVGVNYLSLPALTALQKNVRDGLDMTWTDNAHVHSSGLTKHAQLLGEALASCRGHDFFGAIAFKHQAYEPDPPAAAVMAAKLGMLPTTSGDATGVAADIQKVRSIRAALGAGPLGIASGLTPDNVCEYTPYLTHLLVATGVSRTFYSFDYEKLAVFVSRVRKVGLPA